MQRDSYNLCPKYLNKGKALQYQQEQYNSIQISNKAYILRFSLLKGDQKKEASKNIFIVSATLSYKFS